MSLMAPETSTATSNIVAALHRFPTLPSAHRLFSTPITASVPARFPELKEDDDAVSGTLEDGHLAEFGEIVHPRIGAGIRRED